MYLLDVSFASTISIPTPLYASDDDILFPPAAPFPIEPLHIKKPPFLVPEPAIVLSNPSYPIDLRKAGFVPYISIDSPINIEPLNLFPSVPCITNGAPLNSTSSTIATFSAKLLFAS